MLTIENNFSQKPHGRVKARASTTSMLLKEVGIIKPHGALVGGADPAPAPVGPGHRPSPLPEAGLQAQLLLPPTTPSTWEGLGARQWTVLFGSSSEGHFGGTEVGLGV